MFGRKEPVISNTAYTAQEPPTPSAPAAPAGPVIEQNALIHELLRERKRDRRSGVIKAFLFSLLGLGYVFWMVLFIGAGWKSPVPSEPFAAVVRIQGTIADGKPASYEKLAPLLRRAFLDPQSKGVILQINSPGGTPVQSSLIQDLILELKRITGKPVIAVAEDMMTSGAYMIAVAADTIVANPSSIVGSIGVISAGFGFSELIDFVGIERRVLTAGNSKNMRDPFVPSKPEDEAYQQALLEEIHEHFKTLVREGRGERLDLDTEGLFEGTVWTGTQAVKHGLVDELGRIDFAIKKHLKIAKAYTFEAQKPMWESLLGDLTLKISDNLWSRFESSQRPMLVAP